MVISDEVTADMADAIHRETMWTYRRSHNQPMLEREIRFAMDLLRLSPTFRKYASLIVNPESK